MALGDITNRQIYKLMVTWGILMCADVPDNRQQAKAWAEGIGFLCDALIEEDKQHAKKGKKRGSKSEAEVH